MFRCFVFVIAYFTNTQLTFSFAKKGAKKLCAHCLRRYELLWNVAAPFFQDGHEQWLDDFTSGRRHRFRKIPNYIVKSHDWHGRAGRATPLAEWGHKWKQMRAASNDADGILTVFPPLALLAGIQNRLFLKNSKPIVAWCYNVGSLPSGYRQKIAQMAMKNVDCIVVHSAAEVSLIADWLDMPTDRVRFVPLQIGEIAIEASEDKESPFILAMGSANRDYATLFEAVRRINLPTLVVASPRALAGLTPPSCVQIKHNLSLQECRVLAQRARVSVVPLVNTVTASGQVTVIEAMRMMRPVIATKCVGTADYIIDGQTGLLVNSSDPSDLARALQKLWDDATLRRRLACNGSRFAQETLSDPVCGKALETILDEVADRRQL